MKPTGSRSKKSSGCKRVTITSSLVPKARRAVDRINRIQVNGNLTQDPDQIKSCTTECFQNLIKSHPSSSANTLFRINSPKVLADHNFSLSAFPSQQEIGEVVLSLKRNTSPSPNVLTRMISFRNLVVLAYGRAFKDCPSLLKAAFGTLPVVSPPMVWYLVGESQLSPNSLIINSPLLGRSLSLLC